MTFFFRRLLGIVVGLVARLWLRSLRLVVVEDPALDREDPRPWVLAFFHGEQFALLAWRRRRPTVALVSLSKDGELQSRALRMVGLRVERGSSSKQGARGLRAIVRRLRKGTEDAAFAVDGPKGPRFQVAPGAIAAARACEGALVPMGSAIARGKIFERSWDKYALPAPFSRVVVAIGAPLPASTTPEELQQAIQAASALATRELTMLGSAPPCATSSNSAGTSLPST